MVIPLLLFFIVEAVIFVFIIDTPPHTHFTADANRKSKVFPNQNNVEL